MADTFPGLQQDALDMIQWANRLTTAARELRAQAARGDAEAVREACKEVARIGRSIASLGEDFQNTTDHFVTYPDEEG